MVETGSKHPQTELSKSGIPSEPGCRLARQACGSIFLSIRQIRTDTRLPIAPVTGHKAESPRHPESTTKKILAGAAPARILHRHKASGPLLSRRGQSPRWRSEWAIQLHRLYPTHSDTPRKTAWGL